MFNNVRKFISKYFGFSKSETTGLILLIPLLAFILTIPSIYKQYLIQTQTDNSEKDAQDLREWLAEIEKNKINNKDEEVVFTAFEFDPNLISADSLILLGFEHKVAYTIDNYRSKGGKFFKKEDLLKIYGISENRVKGLWEFISIPDRVREKKYATTSTKTTTYEKKEFTPKKVIIAPEDLNRVTVEELVQIRGIGPVLSDRIIKYRDNLGGFNNIDQLREVYGLDTGVIERITEHFYLKDPEVVQIDINTDSARFLANHPYISWSLAKAIVAYKYQHGSYKSVGNIKKIKLVNDSIFDRVSPYLLVNANTTGE